MIHSWKNETVSFSVQSLIGGAENEKRFQSVVKIIGLSSPFRLLKFSPNKWKPPVNITLFGEKI